MEKMTSVFAMAIQRLTRKPKRLRLASIISQLLKPLWQQRELRAPHADGIGRSGALLARQES
jgi:hypothetical protein